jgi:beta-fructofuranosidase
MAPSTGLIDNLLPDQPAEGLPQHKIKWRYSAFVWRAVYLVVLLSPLLMLRRKAVDSKPDFEQRQGCNLLIGATGFPLRTTYHFRPVKNWMNDPSGPMYYKGFYHIFYQYNPLSASCCDGKEWGHAVSCDMVNWVHLESAIPRDKWYDIRGVWAGSATIRDDGVPVLMYTGSSYDGLQSQSMVTPEDPNDPLLRKWVKAPENPILWPPAGVYRLDFRDPTTAWKDADGHWLMLIGSKEHTGGSGTGTALMYRNASTDFTQWDVLDHFLHHVNGTGMWECVDFYPIPYEGKHGLDTYTEEHKYVLKASIDEDHNRHDFYSIGSYNLTTRTYTPDDPSKDTGIGLRCDYGKYFASKSFYDAGKKRRIVWGWANESDSISASVTKGWAGVMTIPRVISLDHATGRNIIQEPIEELKQLRGEKVTVTDVNLAPGDVVEVKGARGEQLDIEIEFDYPNIRESLEHKSLFEVKDEFNCERGPGAAHRGFFGPFGILVLADEKRQEQTALYFYISYSAEDDSWTTRYCADHSRSSFSPEVIDHSSYGGAFEVLPSEDKLSMRVLVDSQIVESFVQGGRLVLTSRVYPMIAVGQAAHMYLFNNASTNIHVRNVDAWQMRSAALRQM